MVVIDPEFQHLDCFKDYDNTGVKIKVADCLDNNLSKTFLEKMIELGDELHDIIRSETAPMNLSDVEEADFQEATTCYLCQKDIVSSDKVRDHCHLSGKYRGAAHNNCNLQLTMKREFDKIPVLLHNLKGYDSKLILRDLGKVDPSMVENIKVLAQNTEQFKSISVGHVRFIDSFSHLSSSLEKLVDSLKANSDRHYTFQHMSTAFPDECDFNLLLQKGIFPYQFMGNPDNLKAYQLPPRSVFEDRVTAADYNHAQTVWSHFGMESFKDYMELYLKTDVLLLADVVANYKHVTHQEYELDPLWFISCPSLSLTSAMRMTKAEIDLITEVDMSCLISCRKEFVVV